jgi:hypothetical protein
MAEEQKPKSRAKKIQASGVEAELQPANSASVPPGPGAAGVQGVVQASVPAEDEEKLAKERQLFTTLANVCRYVGIAAGIGAIFAPLSPFGGDLSGFGAIIPLIFTGLVLMVMGIIFRSIAAHRKSQLDFIQVARAEEAVRIQQQSQTVEPRAAAAAELIVKDYSIQASRARTSGWIRVSLGGLFLAIALVALTSPVSDLGGGSDCTKWNCNLAVWAGNFALSLGVTIFLDFVLPLIGLILIIRGALGLSRARQIRATLASGISTRKP